MIKIGIVDYGVGNLKSIFNAFNYLGLEIEFINNPINIKKYDKIVLPGVGSFKYCMERIKLTNFDEEIKNFVTNKKMLLGICVGMQMLCSSSSEDGLTDGFNFFKEKVEKFNLNEVASNRIPHIGFNSIYPDSNSKLFKNFNEKADFYFIHSYRVKTNNEKKFYSYFNYGEKFVSSLEKDNIYGVQFHPEKSQLNGIKLFHNFAKI
tara:strand:- start:507 stop:1124 length:618 start_codon:yes stop_codon:yes gene_type:complete